MKELFGEDDPWDAPAHQLKEGALDTLLLETGASQNLLLTSCWMLLINRSRRKKKLMMSIYLSRSFPRSNSSFFLCSGNALQSEVLRLREEMFLVNVGLGTPRICMQDELTGVPINRATRFENKVGSLGVVAGESLIKEQILERFFIDLVAGESLIKERAAARFNDLVGSTDVVAGEPLLIFPRRFRQNRGWNWTRFFERIQR